MTAESSCLLLAPCWAAVCVCCIMHSVCAAVVMFPRLSVLYSVSRSRQHKGAEMLLCVSKFPASLSPMVAQHSPSHAASVVTIQAFQELLTSPPDQDSLRSCWHLFKSGLAARLAAHQVTSGLYLGPAIAVCLQSMCYSDAICHPTHPSRVWKKCVRAL